VSRLPVRVRLTLVFAGAMAVVLAAVGGLLYLRLAHALEDQLDRRLEARADALAVVVEDGRPAADAALGTRDEEGFAQLLAADGAELASSLPAARGPLVPAAELRRVRGAPVFAGPLSVPGYEEPVRLLLVPVDTKRVLAVGESTEDVEDALDGLLAQLLVVAPLALLLTSAAGYALTASALRPVEAMRRHADQISADHPDRRLPLPPARDEIRRLGETLNAMLTRLEEGLERERRFVAEASHELRTPLGLLQAELELALRRPRSREELEAALRSAAEEADRLARLAEDLLVLARLHDGRLALRLEPVEPQELVATVARRFEPRLAAQGRALVVDAERAAPLVGDRLRLEQALGNLVDNALRHGAGAIRLEAEAVDGERLELRVRDEGPGFPPELVRRAFDRFARSDEARAGAGSGLGLTIVDAVARAHGGSASAANAGPAGACVAITLPLPGGP
jgi:signal transduction histidine kinase